MRTCPFCLQDFPSARVCPECEVHLLERGATRHAQPVATPGIATTAIGRSAPGSRTLRLIALCGLVSFAVGPWVQMTAPYSAVYSGWDLANTRLPWLWGGAIAWCGILLLSSSGNYSRWRAVLAALSATSASEAILLLTIAPTQPGKVVFIYHFGWGLYSTLALGLAGCGLAALAGLGPKPQSLTPRQLTTGQPRDPSRPVH